MIGSQLASSNKTRVTGERRENKDAFRLWSLSGSTRAEWDAIAMETEPYPVPFEMSRAGVGRTHRRWSLISKALKLSGHDTQIMKLSAQRRQTESVNIRAVSASTVS